MRMTDEKKKAIISYILEKISQNTPSLSSVVAKALDISTNTVHKYLTELQGSGVIEKHKRGEYRLLTQHSSYSFSRSENELRDDTLAYDVCVSPLINHLSDNVKHIWEYALSEMVNNVIDHSDADNMRVLVAHNYLETSVGIIDDGVGIFEKIKKHFSLPDLDEAICELFKGKLTTDSDNHSGEGIFFTSKMMDNFIIYSSGKIFTTSKYNNEHVFDVDDLNVGTFVFMSLSNFTNKTARDIFDMYSDVDGGFTTTRIPLKNIFDSAPVSRSQAKRICNRLEQFEEILLDFEGVGWMGQGFAHQIFVVFKNAHPNISIKPINMCESVEAMYNHVTKSK